jgi:hypothetical protein
MRSHRTAFVELHVRARKARRAEVLGASQRPADAAAPRFGLRRPRHFLFSAPGGVRSDTYRRAILALAALLCFALPVAPEEQAPPLSLSITTERGDAAVYTEGEAVVFLVSVSEPVWLRLYHFSADGTVRIIWHSGLRRGAILPAGEAQRIPGPGDRYEFVASPPFGSETVVAVASTRPIDPADPSLPTLSDPATDPGGRIPHGLTEAEDYPPARAKARVTFTTVPASP